MGTLTRESETINNTGGWGIQMFSTRGPTNIDSYPSRGPLLKVFLAMVLTMYKGITLEINLGTKLGQKGVVLDGHG